MLVRMSQFGRRLQGKPSGRKHFAGVCGSLAGAASGEVAFLDFKGVESVNASWINVAIAPLVRWAVEGPNDFFPVLAHFPEKDLDELDLVADKNQQCYLIAANATEPVRSVRLVGPLDPGLRATLLKLAELGEATGAQLAREVPDAEILPTAWNNRLKDLYDKRLLLRRKAGRQQVYFPVAQEIVLHG